MNNRHCLLFFGPILVWALAVTAFAAPRSLLYSQEAGFPREGAITVAEGLSPGADYWNRAARSDIFVVSDAPKITLHDATGICLYACAAPVSVHTHTLSLTDPYERCEIYTVPNVPANILAHELGHCLGFDHGGRGATSSRLRPSPRFDRKQLRMAGYVHTHL